MPPPFRLRSASAPLRRPALCVLGPLRSFRWDTDEITPQAAAIRQTARSADQTAAGSRLLDGKPIAGFRRYNVGLSQSRANGVLSAGRGTRRLITRRHSARAGRWSRRRRCREPQTGVEITYGPAPVVKKAYRPAEVHKRGVGLRAGPFCNFRRSGLNPRST